MDLETLVECYLEVSTCGRHRFDALDILLNESRKTPCALRAVEIEALLQGMLQDGPKQAISEEAIQRLFAVLKTCDGFEQQYASVLADRLLGRRNTCR